MKQWKAFSKTGVVDPVDLQAVIAAVVAQGTVKRPRRLGIFTIPRMSSRQEAVSRIEIPAPIRMEGAGRRGRALLAA